MPGALGGVMQIAHGAPGAIVAAPGGASAASRRATSGFAPIHGCASARHRHVDLDLAHELVRLRIDHLDAAVAAVADVDVALRVVGDACAACSGCPSLPPPGSPSDATQSPSFVNFATRELM